MKLKIIRKKIPDNIIHFEMSGNMTIYSIKKLKDILLKDLKSYAGIILNLSEINESDTSAFQLLLFLKREAEATGKKFIIEKPGSRIESIFTLYQETI